MKEQRIKEMQAYILRNESVSLKELCDTFQISMNTVRRYINEITSNSNIKKVYGGVSAQSSALTPSTFAERNQTQAQAKQLIAKKASTFIKENDIIFIDSGTTTMHLINYIPEYLPVTIITNSFYIIRMTIDRPAITLISLPGILDRRTMSFSSDNTKYLDSLNINKAFMACTGISVRDGITNSFSTECINKKIAVRKAEEIILLADSSKFGLSTLLTYCNLADVNYLITDKMPGKEFVQIIQDTKHELVLCDEEN